MSNHAFISYRMPLDCTFTVLYGVFMLLFIIHGIDLYRKIKESYPVVAKNNKKLLIAIVVLGAFQCFLRMVFGSIADVARIGKIKSIREDSPHW